jgi:hypothetical protein
LINAAAIPILTVAPIPACKLKWAGSIPPAASPVITPPAAPLIPAATIPFSQIRRCEILLLIISAYFLDPRSLNSALLLTIL